MAAPTSTRPSTASTPTGRAGRRPMPRWLDVALGVVGLVLGAGALAARMLRHSEGPSYLRAGILMGIALVVLAVVFALSRRRA